MFLIRLYCPEVLLGLPSVDEVRDITGDVEVIPAAMADPRTEAIERAKAAGTYTEAMDAMKTAKEIDAAATAASLPAQPAAATADAIARIVLMEFALGRDATVDARKAAGVPLSATLERVPANRLAALEAMLVKASEKTMDDRAYEAHEIAKAAQDEAFG
jgi:hypothetical protein